MSGSSHFLSPPSTTTTTTTSKRAKPPPTPTNHASLRILCHASCIGAFIGKSGSSIKQLQLDTGSKIRVEDSSGSDHRVIVIVAPSFPFKKLQLRRYDGVDIEVEVSAFQEAAIRVFEKILEVSKGGNGDVALCRVLVEEREAGAVIGKGGKIVQKLKRESRAKIRVLLGDQLPSCVSSPDELVEIEGDAFAVKKALLGVCGELQEYSPMEKSSIQESKPLETTYSSTGHNFNADFFQQISMQSVGHEFHVDLPVHRTSLQPAVRGIFGDSPLYRAPHQPSSHDYNVDPLLHRTPLLGVGATMPSTSSKIDKILTSDSKPQQDVVFRILCLNDRIGSVIGRERTIVKALQDESGASIYIGPPVANCDERLITVSSKEDVESKYSPAQRAAFLVFCRSVGAASEKGLEPDLQNGSIVSARLLVPTNQVGCLLGRGGFIISEMRKVTGASIRLINGDQLPKCAEPNDEIVEISGKFASVQDALYSVTSKLRNNLFSSKKMTSGTGNSNLISDTSVYGNVGDGTLIGTSQFVNGQATSRHGLDRPSGLHTQSQLPENCGANASGFVTPGKGLASATSGLEHSSTQRSAIVTNTTKVEIVVPENSISSVYGKNGSNLTKIRQISGAEVNIDEAIPGTTERTVIICGTPLQTQTAQSLIHAFILPPSS